MRELMSRNLPDNPVNLGFLLFFVGAFVVVLWAVLHNLDQQQLEREARLPLED